MLIPLYFCPTSHINVKIVFEEGEGKVPLDAIAEREKKYQPKPKITYKMIQEYVEKKYGFIEELKHPRKYLLKEKVEAITEALKYFEVI